MSNYQKEQSTKKNQSPSNFTAGKVDTVKKGDGTKKFDADHKNTGKKDKDGRRN